MATTQTKIVGFEERTAEFSDIKQILEAAQHGLVHVYDLPRGWPWSQGGVLLSNRPDLTEKEQRAEWSKLLAKFGERLDD